MDFVVDIDGTIADIGHRRHWLNPEGLVDSSTGRKIKKNWRMFFQDMDRDVPIKPIITVVECLMADFNRAIFCTGRAEEFRDASLNFIRDHIWDRSDIVLYMRADGDHRADDIVKQELLGQMRRDGYDPKLAFEDRTRVVEMWRRNGLICAQVAPGNF